MATEHNIHVIIVAAGVGRRFAHDEGPPKQYQLIGKKTVLAHSIAAFDDIPVAGITVVIHEQDRYWQDITAPSAHRLKHTLGGLQRHDSVRNGIRSLQADPMDWVLVHDAARPCVTTAEIDKLINRCVTAQQGGLLVLPVTDTIKFSASGERVENTIDRQQLFAALTPQMFRCGDLLKALTVFEADSITDESSAIEAQGQKPLMVRGSRSNLKITEFADLAMAHRILEQQGRLA